MTEIDELKAEVLRLSRDLVLMTIGRSQDGVRLSVLEHRLDTGDEWQNVTHNRANGLNRRLADIEASAMALAGKDADDDIKIGGSA